MKKKTPTPTRAPLPRQRCVTHRVKTKVLPRKAKHKTREVE